MATKRFLVQGDNVTGDHRATRGRDAIKVVGQTSYHVYAYLNDEDKCWSLIGHAHIGLDTPYTILETAERGKYLIATQPPSPTGEPSNGTLRVGSRGDDDEGEDEGEDDDESP